MAPEAITHLPVLTPARVGIAIEHNMPLAMSVSDMVCVLDFGRLIACGTPEHVCQDEGLIKAYLGPQEAKSAS